MLILAHHRHSVDMTFSFSPENLAKQVEHLDTYSIISYPLVKNVANYYTEYSGAH